MATGELSPNGDSDSASDGDAVNPDAVLASEEIRLLLEATTPGYYRTLFTAAFITGMRSGELLALRDNSPPAGRCHQVLCTAHCLDHSSIASRLNRQSLPILNAPRILCS
jgi:hypothetical protein